MDCSLLAGLLCPAGLDRCGTGRGDDMIPIAGATADANRPYYRAIQLQRDAASRNHDFAVVRNMNAEELAPRLRMLCQFLRFDVKCARRVSLLHGDINAAKPCVVHTNVRYDISAFVSLCDVHGLANFSGFLLRRADYAAGIFQFHCGHGFSSRGGFPAIGSRLFLQLARLSLRLLSDEKALPRDWREQRSM